MSEHPELDYRVKELEALVKKQATQIEGLRQSVDILIGMIYSKIESEEEEQDTTVGPQAPMSPPGPGFNT